MDYSSRSKRRQLLLFLLVFFKPVVSSFAFQHQPTYRVPFKDQPSSTTTTSCCFISRSKFIYYDRMYCRENTSLSSSSTTNPQQQDQDEHRRQQWQDIFVEKDAAKNTIKELPIMDIMDDIMQSIKVKSNLILEAPPGAGKTTCVPLACYGCENAIFDDNDDDAKTIIVVEPRRVAARSAAIRMANLIGDESVGKRVGYIIRGESRISSKTKIIVMTDGVLLNKIQQDPELSNVDMIILDEFHERGVGSDTALALCREVQTLLRPDLKLIVMSATLLGEYNRNNNNHEENDTNSSSSSNNNDPSSSHTTTTTIQQQQSTAEKLVHALGGNEECNILRSDGRQYPIEVKWPKQIDWKKSTTTNTRLQPLGILLRDRKLLVDIMCTAIEQAIIHAPGRGDVLAFLPGVAEIKRVIQTLQERRNNIISNNNKKVEIVPLYGALPKDQQDYVIFPPNKNSDSSNSPQRIIVSTPIAEASLTLEGVTCVVDSGLRREPRCDADTAMPRLITTRCSKASAIQRSGRAGRVQPGLCLRIYSESEFDDQFLEHSPAEIASSDLSPTLLLLADWGCSSEQEILKELPFVDPPNPELLKKAIQLLVDLKALELRDEDDDKGHSSTRSSRFSITSIGKEIAKIPAHPRFATALVRASKDHVLLAAAAAATFIMDDEMGVRGPTDPDMGSLIDKAFSKSNSRSLLRFAQRISNSAKEAVEAVLVGTISPAEVRQVLGRALLPGFIDLVANRKGDASYGGSTYLLSLGRSARLDGIRDTSLQYVVVLDTSTGDDGITRIRSYVPIDKQQLLDVAEERETIFTVPSRGHEVRARKVLQVGRLELDSTTLPAPPTEQIATALKDVISNMGGVGPALVKTLSGDKRVLVDEICSRVRLAKKLSEEDGSVWPDCFAALDSNCNGTPSEEEMVILDEMIDPWFSGVKSLKEINIYEILQGCLSPDQQRHLDRDYPSRIVAPDGSKIPVRYSSSSSSDSTSTNSTTASAKLQQFFGAIESPMVGPQNNPIPISLSLLSPGGKVLALTSNLPFFWKEVYPSIRAEMRGRYAKHPWPEDPLTATATRQTKKQEVAAKLRNSSTKNDDGMATDDSNNGRNKGKKKNRRRRK